MVALEVMEKFASGDEMCSFARCGESDWFRFLFHIPSTIKEVSFGVLSSFILCLQFSIADHFLLLFLGKQIPLGYTVRCF